MRPDEPLMATRRRRRTTSGVLNALRLVFINLISLQLAVRNLLLLPMWMLSGAFFPANGATDAATTE